MKTVYNYSVTTNSTGSVCNTFDYAGRRTGTWRASTNIGTEGRIYWGNRQIAFRALDGQTYFEHQDWLGTERERSNYQGQPASTHFSMAFGEGSSVSVAYGSAGQDNAQYTGLEFDAVTNTNHARFRQYSPVQGRWMSPDPYDGSYDAGNPQSLNRYVYALNNPLAFRDPTGLFCEYGDEYGEGVLEERDYDSSPAECGATGGSWSNDGWGSVGGTVDGGLGSGGASTGGNNSGNIPYLPAPAMPGIAAPSKQQPPVDANQRRSACKGGIVQTSVGVVTTVGAGVVMTVAWPLVTEAAAVEGAELVTAGAAQTVANGGAAMSFVHSLDALGHLLVAPLFLVAHGANDIAANCF